MKKIGSLNALYQENRIFYHCNACGDINVPGKPALYCGTVDDLPASVRELYENVWSEVDGWPEYVVTMDGKPCMAFSILVDKGYIRELTDSYTAGKDRIDTAASEVCKATAQSLQEKLPCGQVFYGENTDPCGDEVLVCVDKDLVEKYWSEVLKSGKDNFYPEFERRLAQATKSLGERK